MNILEKNISTQFSVKGSRFLSELFPCISQTQAKEIIKSQKEKYFDSTHVVHAFMIGLKGEICGMSDDGEPSGTAARPMLDVIKGKNCTNTLLTVTRWFGGTLLGTGGLVKAYGDAAKEAFLEAEKQNAISEYVEKVQFSFSCNYKLYEIVKRIMENFSISDKNETFLENANFSGKIRMSEYQVFLKKIQDATKGEVEIKKW